MKKQNLNSAILLGLFIGWASISSAQSDNFSDKAFEKGSVTFSAGLGIGNEYSSNYYSAAFGAKAVIEKGFWQAGPGVISLGGELGGSFSNGGSLGNYKANTVILAARSAWHNGWNVKSLDTYAGLSGGLGFNQYKYYKDGFISQSEIIPVFAGFIGVSYYVTPTFGLNIELGNDITRIQGGIVIKIR